MSEAELPNQELVQQAIDHLTKAKSLLEILSAKEGQAVGSREDELGINDVEKALESTDLDLATHQVLDMRYKAAESHVSKAINELQRPLNLQPQNLAESIRQNSPFPLFFH